MTIIEKQNIKQFHAVRLKDKTITRSKMMGWTTKQAQQLRFEAIVSLFDFNNASVLDIGCGDGDFKAFLDERFVNIDYIGIDIQNQFIDFAKKRFKDQKNTWFYHTDFTTCQLPNVDVVVACGALSYKSAIPDFYTKMIEKFYKAASQAFIFNMLNAAYFESGNIIVAHSKTQIYEYCQTLSCNVKIVDNYLKNDFTIIMHK
ncbi:class I SAM-dependent methyltransferase [Lacinutrix chionoecetis]